jgi:hypothetical protein
MVAHPSHATDLKQGPEAELNRLAARPQCLEDTGLSQAFVGDLVAKHLLDGGVQSLTQLVSRLALTGRILESLLHFMRQEAKVEVLAADDSGAGLRYGLTDRGRTAALDAMLRSGYVGPTPIRLADYARVVRAQTVHERSITKDAMRSAFEGVVLEESLIDQLGPSLNSGRAIFVYGPAGTGKTYVAQKLRRLFRDRTLIPYAIVINESVVEVFDPIMHKAIADEDGGPDLMLERGYDPRFVCCERPVVITGGELTADMLEVQYDAASRQYRAPLQLKANNGMFMIDDMGRQRVAPEVVFNRWIVPMEEKKDYLHLGSGRHFSVPFDTVLIFSTNMHPLDLADEAFLRRIGYKIKFEHLAPEAYRRIWKGECDRLGVLFDREILEFVLQELHEKKRVALLPCHPRDLLGIAVDLATYVDQPRTLTKQQMRWAWNNYFVEMDDRNSNHAGSTT